MGLFKLISSLFYSDENGTYAMGKYRDTNSDISMNKDFRSKNIYTGNTKQVKNDSSTGYKSQYVERKEDYENTSYSADTNIPYNNLDKKSGTVGEFLMYKVLQSLEGEEVKFLFNTYIPRKDGKTSEIDMICVCSNGIIVFESKDRSGWIFGDEYGQKWTQTMYNGKEVKKYYFYNPVIQNKMHINNLRNWLELDENFPIWSVVVFSDHCELKKLEIFSESVIVVRRRELYNEIKYIMDNYNQVLNKEGIESIYNTLYPFTQACVEVRDQHIEDVKEYEK